ncbi:MAG: hypothetical protein N3E45_10585 [Oscillatoriaceae bacterium SKW80]|nr:hypothetical protein [Oscillatoriaceae bacterium SKYG93]MCX8121260.1 hypothetical protein [Oscillatoriaceae bacterium SKW80]MDW8453406.1 hypothetical protein [Oscillatoriaceae cyanobacterium SKYGB_i_bin93]HIK26761.1 hypothetical protein [Oscillatoriaceae cyanobacterium M7585_C2015_266]
MGNELTEFVATKKIQRSQAVGAIAVYQYQKLRRTAKTYTTVEPEEVDAANSCKRSC